MYLILKRIGKNNEYYLLEVLNIPESKTELKLYERKNKNLVDLDYSKLSFVNFETGKKLTQFPSEKHIDLSKFKIHCFSNKSPELRNMTHTIKVDNVLFTPCCGKTEDHENTKIWGKYINEFEIEDYGKIEGYMILDNNMFDKYIMNFSPQKYILNLNVKEDFLLKVLSDFIEDQFITTSDQVEIKITHKSGKEIIVNLIE